MSIVVDIGNTFLKMARWNGRHLGTPVRVRHRGIADEDWQSRLDALRPEKNEPVLVATVARDTVVQRFEHWLVTSPAMPPVFIRSQAEALGVVNAYSDPERLGVDRWCAMLAARRLHRGMLCVVDVGTALTLDAVDPQGRHLGGVIMPGPSLQAESLLRGTGNIRESAETPAGLLADNTADAVVSGTCYGCAALVDLAMRRLDGAGAGLPKLVLTGGEAHRILPLLEYEADMQQDLVLYGIALHDENGDD